VNGDELAPIVGVSAAIRKAVRLVERFAPTELSILLVGATGVGKELFARHIHHRSRRRGELVDVDCGALPRDMVEGLLFGYRRGAFTGAVEERRGLIEASHGGTLFLDELTSLPEEGQRKLLRVLETSEVRRLGETQKRRVDLRVVAAAQDDLDEGLVTGALRRDLYERLSGVVIRLPPLAERRNDIVAIARHFTTLQGRTLDARAERVLTEYPWPGNVRELRKVIERAGAMVSNGSLPPWALLEAIALGLPPAPTSVGGRRRIGVPPGELDRLRSLGEAHGWDAQKMADAEGLGRSGLYARLKRVGVSMKELRASTQSSGRPVDNVDPGAAVRA
jgi:transcriptional regulator with PAS, ATPase and Fis domain